MKMILILVLAGVCASAGLTPPSLPPIPPYLDMRQQIATLNIVLKEQIVSMENEKEIPNLTDHRRHYAEIFHVIHHLAHTQIGCVPLPYELYYQREVNTSTIVGIGEPQAVIDETKKLISHIENGTSLVEELIKETCVFKFLDCERDVDKTIHDSKDPLKKQAKIFIAAGAAAEVILGKHPEILYTSKSYGSLQYVINGIQVLKEVIMKLGDLLREIDRSNKTTMQSALC